MRRKVLSLAIVVVSLLLISTVTFAALKSVAKLVAAEARYDFGTVREGINVPVTFTVTNLGADEAKVEKVLQAAGCISSGPPFEGTLAPGESARLEYIFESLGYGGVSVSKWIRIYYNNPKLSPLELTVTGKVLPVEPYQAPVGELMYNFFVLVDVQSQESFAKEHIIGAINVPYEELSKWASNASKNVKDNAIIYLCSKDGTKSDKAAQMLRKKGFSHCLSLVGGLTEWKEQYGMGLLISGRW